MIQPQQPAPPTPEHDFQHLYSGVYPDGSKIGTRLCGHCGIIELCVKSPYITDAAGKLIDQFFYFNQPQANELAYAMLKGNNRFAHIIEDQVLDSITIPGNGEDGHPARPIRLGA